MGRPNQRLRREVRRLLKAGRVYRGRFVHVRAGPSAHGATLISVRRRYGSAVARNRVRRRIRAICREAALSRPGGRLLLISVSDRAGQASFPALRKELLNAFGELGLL